jgi:ABC-type iron transport system FetAB ATPase subunit
MLKNKINQTNKEKTADMLSKYVGEERTYTMFITGDGK